MEYQRRSPRPKKWVQRVIYAVTWFRKDHREQLLEFRADYRALHRQFGRREADRFARSQAIHWLGCGFEMTAALALRFGKRLIIG